MNRRIQIFIITPFFFSMVTLSCMLFAKLDREHRAKLAFDETLLERVQLKGLQDETKEAVRYVVDSLATTSNFRLSWSKRFLTGIESISDANISGFDLIAFILQDEQIEESLVLVKNEKNKYNRLLQVLSDSLVREYESDCFFDRARRFANCIGIEESAVIKVLKEGIEAVKCEGDLASIEALLDFFAGGKELSSQFSYSLL